jgi:hypothetical protein
MNDRNLSGIPCPSILGTRLGSIGHFIILLKHDGDRLVIGDPLCGRLNLTQEAFLKRYAFDGFAMNFSRADRDYQYKCSIQLIIRLCKVRTARYAAAGRSEQRSAVSV